MSTKTFYLSSSIPKSNLVRCRIDAGCGERFDLAGTSLCNSLPRAVIPPTPIMQAHYFGHYCFLEPGQLLANADRLASIPGVIVQGRYDHAFALSAAWPKARLRLVGGAGHSMSEPGITEAIVEAVEELAGEEGAGRC